MKDEKLMTFNVLTCSRLPLSYIFDMYTIYTKLAITQLVLETKYEKMDFSERECLFLQNDMTIKILLPKYYDPNLWLFQPFQNILLFQHKKECDTESLELYINCLCKTEKYYILGENATVLLLETNGNEKTLIHSSTINMLLERSTFCNRPFFIELL